jgi:hypothetical protein
MKTLLTATLLLTMALPALAASHFYRGHIARYGSGGVYLQCDTGIFFMPSRSTRFLIKNIAVNLSPTGYPVGTELVAECDSSFVPQAASYPDAEADGSNDYFSPGYYQSGYVNGSYYRAGYRH